MALTVRFPVSTWREYFGVVHLALFALLCAHAIIRRTMSLPADRAGTSPGGLSFTNSLRLITQAALHRLGAPAARLSDLYRV